MRVLCHMGAESSRKRLLFSVLVGFERRASNGVKRAFYLATTKKVPRNKVSLKRGVLGTWGRAEDSNRKWEKTEQYKEKLHLEWSMGQKR